MTKISNKAQLKNRFHNAEMSLDGITEIETTPEIKKTPPKKPNDRPALYMYLGFIFRALKISFSFLSRGVQLIWKEVLAPVLKESIKTIIYTIGKTKEIKNKSEVLLDKKLSKVENKIQIEKEQLKIISKTINESMANYENELAQLFIGKTRKVELQCEENVFIKANSSLEFDVSLYELMSNKLSENKMITNVAGIKIHSLLDGKIVRNSIEFDLNSSGERWSRLFSMHISSEILRRIESYKGNVENLHYITNEKSQEKFEFVFTHQRLDLYMDKAREEKTPSVSSSIRKSQPELSL
jgi:hypothetical protein